MNAGSVVLSTNLAALVSGADRLVVRRTEYWCQDVPIRRTVQRAQHGQQQRAADQDEREQAEEHPAPARVLGERAGHDRSQQGRQLAEAVWQLGCEFLSPLQESEVRALTGQRLTSSGS